MKLAAALLLVLVAPAQAAQCRLSADDCQVVAGELAAEREFAGRNAKRAHFVTPYPA